MGNLKMKVIRESMPYLETPPYIWIELNGCITHMSRLDIETLEKSIKRIKRDIKKIDIYPDVVCDELKDLAYRKISELEIAMVYMLKQPYFSL